MTDRLGVGIVGCGAAAQAIHLPTLASLPEFFGVTHCMDADAKLAEVVADRVGARHTTSVDAVLDDPDVDVVLLCSPSALHAEQALAACSAGKRAVLCEKPLAETVEDADRIVAASEESGVPVVAGTMHRYDPALRQLEAVWGDLPERAHLVRSTTYVMPNPWVVAMATQPAGPGGEPAPEDGGPSLAAGMELVMFRGLMLGLFVHHAPLVRLALPAANEVEVATPLGTSGYQASVRSGDRLAQLSGLLFGFPRIEWTFELWAADRQARVEFPAGYLPSQSATAMLWSDSGALLREERFGAAHETGYRAEWLHVADVVRGDAEPLTGAASAREDVALACRIAEAAEARAEGTS